MREFTRLRRAIEDEAHSSDRLALLITAADLAVYLTALLAFCVRSGPDRWLALLVASIMAGALFLVGHDASHRALAKTSWLNALLAYIAFIPTLHPQAAWIVGHNRRHHGFTNLRGIDYVWTPWSAEEYLAASGVARMLYRLYRTPAGIGLYYPIEIWLRHMWRTDPLDRTHVDPRRLLADKCVAIGGFGCIIAGCFAAALTRSPSIAGAATTALVAVIAPLAVYHYLMSVVIFIHHTHPKVRWFWSAQTYDPLVAQLQDTIHIRLPKPVELLFHDIFQHTAHHLDPRIPLYRLARAQRTLEGDGGTAVVQERFSARYLLRLMRDCQLYDYHAGRWLTIEEATRAARPPRTLAAQLPRQQRV